MTRYLQVGSIVLLMHIVGSALFFGYLSGPTAIIWAPLTGLFGWFFVIPELIGVALQWLLYDPYPKPSMRKFAGYAASSALVGGAVVAVLVPKEQGSHLEFWIAGLLAGAGAAIFSFLCIHLVKSMEIGNANKPLVDDP
ncbi:hypothetical protein [Haloferula sp. A504]|uniref:hypothetical protein n=1 Tax=Haloferula sp. A504 TaxID=3373601 RepID=UPI0031C08FA7|nr:hypothetical protein [Verrucomicrobiaceae bacterium E54]